LGAVDDSHAFLFLFETRSLGSTPNLLSFILMAVTLFNLLSYLTGFAVDINPSLSLDSKSLFSVITK
jgi:hypothetical protein